MLLGCKKILVFFPTKNHHFYFETCTDVARLQEKSNLLLDQKSSFYFVICMDVFGFQEKSSLSSNQKSSFLFYNLYGCFWDARKV